MEKGVFFVVLVIAVIKAEKDFFASLTELQDLYNVEGKMLSNLEHFINEMEANIGKTKQIVEQIKARRKTVVDISQFMQNPINAFIYVRSINEFLPQIMEFLDPVYGIVNVFEEIEEKGGWPGVDDLNGAASAILRLQSTYNLNIDSLIQGRIYNQTAIPLSIQDCSLIGAVAYDKHKYGESKMWAKKALELCKEPENMEICDSNFMVNTYELLAYTEFMMDDFPNALTLTNSIIELMPNYTRAHTNQKYLIEEINDVPQHERSGEFMKDPAGLFDHERYYYYTCRGMTHINPEIKQKLTCRYVHYNNPYLMVGPIKEEEAYLEPRIVLLRDLMFDSEIQEIQTLSKAYLERSKTQDGVLNDVRVSKVAWLGAEAGQLPNKLKKRFAVYSDLSHETAESLQAVNYGLGGHYLTHMDAFSEEASKSQWGSLGNRIATLLVYMNKVEEGGSTVFPSLGLSVKPEKGAAVLWYNLFNDGSLDRETLHAACPVLLGTKWAINLWFHEAGHEFKKPCLPKTSNNPIRHT